MRNKMAQIIEVDQLAINNISKRLAGNDPAVRNYTVKKLKRLLERSSSTDNGLITEINLQRLWMGLHYCMWMADKPIFQEDLAEKLAMLVHAFKDPDQSLLFFEAFLRIEAQEWLLLDCFRLDKFMMLIRKVIIQILILLKNHEWNLDLTRKFVETVDAILNKEVLASFTTHVLNVIKDELKNIMNGELSENDLWMPDFIELFAKRKQKLVVNRNAKKSKNSKVISASKCAEAMEKAVSAKDIEDATRRLLEFENEVVINREKTLKSRKRKKLVEDEDILQMEEDDDSIDDGKGLDKSDDEDDEEMDLSVDEVSDKELNEEKAKQEKSKFPKENSHNRPRRKQSKKKASLSNNSKHKMKPRKNSLPKNIPGKRPKASDFF